MTTDPTSTDPTPADPTPADPTPVDPPAQRRDWFRTKFPAKTFDSQGTHTGPGPWLDLIGEACLIHPGFFDEPNSTGPWWAGGSVEEYPHARVIHHLDESVSVVALDDLGHTVLTQADTTLRARTQPTPPPAATAPADAAPADPTGDEKGQQQ